MDREMWILRQLETSLTASAEALAERLQVSPRTITNAINTLNRMLAPAASVRPTGGRYRLYILDPQEYSQIRSRLVRATDSLNDPRHRRAQEFGVLLSAKHPVTSDDLADIVCTSRTTVLADIARLREALKPLGVRIEGRSNQGFSLAAEELDLRLAELTLYPAELVDEYPIDDDIVAVVSRITGQAHLSKPSRHYVRRWLTVLLDRTLTGHPLDAMSEEYQRLRNTPAHRIASKLLTEAEDLVSTTFPIEEELFLAMSVAGMRTPDSAQGRQLFPADEEVPGLVDAIFERIAEIMQIHLDADELADEFAHHLTFMLNRIRFRVTIDEESVRSIRYQYPVAHRMAEISRDVIEERTGMRISDSETGLLTGYHQVFLDSHRACPYLRLAIVTATGRVSANLMRIQLDKVLPHGTKYLMLTGDEADESTLARTDLVVATPDVDITTLAVGDVPVIQLGQVFDPAELISRMSRLNLRGHVDLQLTGANSSLLMSMLSPDRFMAMPAGTDYWSATEALVAYLIDQGLVDESFLATLQARENEATMLLDGLVGFPHATIPGAERIVLAMATIPRRPEQPGARVVFLMGVPDKADYDDTILVTVYDEIIRLTNVPDLLNRLSQLTSYEDVFWLMASRPCNPVCPEER